MISKNRLSILCLGMLLLFIMPTAGCESENHNLVTIPPKQANALIEKMEGNLSFVILDIRTPQEYKNGHIANAKLLDYYSKTFIEEMKRLDKNKIYLIYCRSANRSGKTMNLIKDMGFKKVYNMDKGVKGWIKEGYALVK